MVSASKPMPRNMVVYRIPHGGLFLHSVVLIPEAGMHELETLGTPEIILVPNGYHRLDAKAYKDRFPNAKVICPSAAKKAALKKVLVDTTAEEFFPKNGIKFHTIPGLKPWELCYELELAANKKALVFGDALFNLKHLPGFKGKIVKWIGSSGFFGMTGIGKMLLLKDKNLFREWLNTISQRTDVSHLIVCHGESITDVSSALKKALTIL